MLVAGVVGIPARLVGDDGRRGNAGRRGYQWSHPAAPTAIGPRWRAQLGRFGYVRTGAWCSLTGQLRRPGETVPPIRG